MENSKSKSDRRAFLANTGKVFGGGALAFGLMGMKMDDVPEEVTRTPIVELLNLSDSQKRGFSEAALKVSPADLRTIVDPYNENQRMSTRPSPAVRDLTFGDLSDLAGAVSEAAGAKGFKIDCKKSFCCCCCCCCC